MQDLEKGLTGSIKSFLKEKFTQRDIINLLRQYDTFNYGVVDAARRGWPGSDLPMVNKRFEWLFQSKEEGVADEARVLQKEWEVWKEDIAKQTALEAQRQRDWWHSRCGF